ncbi:MAG: hypothetical protein Q4D02_01905 [Clostridia bacterium]|nr:hypothetical protein [Clostridia bacterium]
MIGYIYLGYYSEYGEGYVLLEGVTEEAEKAYQNAIYKTLVSAGEDEEYAKACACGEKDIDMCLYFEKNWFEKVEE